MNKYLYSFVLFIVLFSVDLTANNITINIQNTNSNNSTGYIEIVLESNDSGPYTFNLTGPLNVTFTNSNLLNVIDNLPVGSYCLFVTNADGCTAESCFEIKRCQEWKGRFFCNIALPNPPVLTDVVMLVGQDEDGKLRNNTFQINTSIPQNVLDNILPGILDITNQETTSLLTSGYSPYLVHEQNEISADEILFLYMFDNNGNLLWVYYNGQNATETVPFKNSSSRNSYDDELGVVIGPNPFHNNFEIDISDSRLYNKLRVFNSIGQKVEELNITEKHNIWVDLTGNKSGIYIIELTGKLSRKSIKIVKLE